MEKHSGESVSLMLQRLAANATVLADVLGHRMTFNLVRKAPGNDNGCTALIALRGMYHTAFLHLPEAVTGANTGEDRAL